MKKIVLLLGSSVLSFSVKAAQTFDCGSNCLATLYEDGTFLVEPIDKDLTAKMTDEYEVEHIDGKYQSTAPWMAEQYSSAFKKVIIAQGVENIGEASFYNAGNIQEVVLYNGLENIGFHAFGGIKSSEIIIPDSVKKIEGCAFDYSAFESVVIPNSVEEIGREAFYHLQKLKGIVIGDSVTSVGVQAFGDLNGDAKIYCQNTTAHQCSEIINDTTGGNDKLILYAKDKTTGFYQTEDGKLFANIDLMAHGAACTSAENCDEILASNGASFKVGSKIYNSLEDFAKGNNVKYRIYTIDEANRVAGDKNRVSITYR